MRRRYDEEFRNSALGMIAAGRSVPDVASLLGISENILYRWRSMAQAAKGHATGPEAEIEQLKLRLRQTEMERDILKKALFIFSRTT